MTLETVSRIIIFVLSYATILWLIWFLHGDLCEVAGIAAILWLPHFLTKVMELGVEDDVADHDEIEVIEVEV